MKANCQTESSSIASSLRWFLSQVAPVSMHSSPTDVTRLIKKVKTCYPTFIGLTYYSCMMTRNCVPTIPIKSPSILTFFRLGLGREMGPTNQPQHRREPPSTFFVFPHGRHRPPNSPGHRRSRPRGSPRRDLHRVSPLHRGCEYSKAFAVLGPKILL